MTVYQLISVVSGGSYEDYFQTIRVRGIFTSVDKLLKAVDIDTLKDFGVYAKTTKRAKLVMDFIESKEINYTMSNYWDNYDFNLYIEEFELDKLKEIE